MSLKIKKLKSGGGEATFALLGDLNFQSVTTIGQEVQQQFAPFPVIIIDMSQVQQANSAGLALMIAWMQEAKRRNKTMQYIGVPCSLAGIARACYVDEFVPITTEKPC